MSENKAPRPSPHAGVAGQPSRAGPGAKGHEPASPSHPADGTEPQEGGEQHHAGLSPRHQRVAGLLMQLATTARSFLLYDAHNEAINRFITALLDGFVSTLKEEGRIALDVQPFELHFEKEPVYLNRDRERSLAFRLYRDGVRALTFRNGFDWEELAKLLEIFSIRYTGVHQHEDDVVTLLWKANFKHLDIVAVEGFVPEDTEEAEPTASAAHAAVLPDTIDLPRPALPPPSELSWVPVSPETQEALRDEASASALPDDCLLLLRRLRRLLDDPGERMTFSEVAHVFSEIRDFLLSDENLVSLTRLIRLLRELAGAPPPEWDPGRATAATELLRSSADDRAVRRLLHTVPAEEREPRPELVEILDQGCANPLAAVADALAVEQGPAARAVARQLLVRYGAGHADVLRQRFEQAKGHVAHDLMQVITKVGGDGAAVFCAHQTSHPEPEVQEEALRALEAMPYSGTMGRALSDAFRRTDGPRRARVLALIGRSRDRRFVDFLAEHIEHQASHLGAQEAAEIGKVLGQLGAAAHLPQWQEWLKPTGLLRKGIHGPLARQVAAAAALAEIPGEDAAKALRAALVAAGPEAEPWIGRALAHHQRDLPRRAP